MALSLKRIRVSSVEAGFASCLRKVAITTGSAPKNFEFAFAEFAAHFSRHADNERVRRNLHAFAHESTRTDQRAASDAGSVQHGCADTDQDVVLNDAAVHGGAMSDRNALANDNWPFAQCAMQDGSILDVGVRADRNAVDITANDGGVPDRDAVAAAYVPDDGSAGCDKYRACELRFDSGKR